MQKFLCLIVLLAIGLSSSCTWFRPAPPELPAEDALFTRVSYAQLPQPVKDWVNNARRMPVAQELGFQGRRYIMASYGERPSSGYAIRIEDVTGGNGVLTVTINYTQPTPGQQVTEVTTYPRDVVFVTNFHNPLEFAATGSEVHVPRLQGIQTLREIVAESPGIKIFTPAPGDHVHRNLIVSGVANVFEGTILWQVEDLNSNIVKAGFTTAGMGDWYYYEFAILVPEEVPLNSRIKLSLYTESPETGEIENVITIPLLLVQE